MKKKTKVTGIRGGYTPSWKKTGFLNKVIPTAMRYNNAYSKGGALGVAHEYTNTDFEKHLKHIQHTGEHWITEKRGRPAGSSKGGVGVNDAASQGPASSGGVTASSYKTTRLHTHSKALMTVFTAADKTTVRFKNAWKVQSAFDGYQAVWDSAYIIIANTATSTTLASVPPTTTRPEFAAFMSGGYAQNSAAAATGTIPALFASPVFANTTTSNTSRMFIEWCKVETLLTNEGQTTILVDIYECLAKNDFNANAANGAGFGSCVSPVSQWELGYNLNQVPGIAVVANPAVSAAAMTPGTFNEKPWVSQFFRDFWLVSWKKTITLEPGATHKHLSTYVMNDFINYSRWLWTPALGGLTRNIMCVARGLPVVNSVTGITTDAIDVAIMQTQTYKTAAIPNDVYQEINYDATIPGGLLANNREVIAQTGAINTTEAQG